MSYRIIIEKLPLSKYPNLSGRIYYSFIYGAHAHLSHATRYHSYEAAKPTVDFLSKAHPDCQVCAVKLI